jgi:hypothetical protein
LWTKSRYWRKAMSFEPDTAILHEDEIELDDDSSDAKYSGLRKGRIRKL